MGVPLFVRNMELKMDNCGVGFADGLDDAVLWLWRMKFHVIPRSEATWESVSCGARHRAAFGGKELRIARR